MKVEEMIKILVEEKNYDKMQTERLAQKIEALPDEIREALENWIKTDVMSGPEYSGYNVEKILALKPSMTVLSGYLTLDWIRKDPKVAIKAINQPMMKRNM